MNRVGSTKLPKIISTFFAVLLCFTTFAQENAEAWKKFFDNDRDGAYKLFNEAVSQKQSADAYLGLTLLANTSKERSEVISNFMKFYDKSERPEPYIQALWSQLFIAGQKETKSDAEIAFLKRIASSTSVDGALVANANLAIAKYLIQKKLGGYVEYADKVKSISKWSVVGEFENISTSGFDKNYAPVSQVDNSKPFINKFGARVGWFDIPAVRNDRWVDFTYYFSNSHNSIVYAQAFVTSDKDQEVQLRIGVSGSVKAWVNDALAISEQEERNNGTDSYIAIVKLNKGVNRLLIQLGESYCNNLNFMVRLTDQKGMPIDGLVVSTEPQSYKKETSYVAKAVTPEAVTYFKDKIKAEPNNVLYHVMLASIYLNADMDYEAQHALADAQKLAPNSSYILLQQVELCMRTDNRTMLTTYQEKIKDVDPDHPYSLALKYSDAFQREDYKEAASYNQKLESIFGTSNREVIRKKINLAAKNKSYTELVELAEKAYNKYPDDAEFVEYKYLIEKNVRANEKEAVAAYITYLKNNDSYSILSKLAKSYEEKSDPNSALKLYEEDAKVDPVGVDLYDKQGKIYFKLQNYEKAKELFLKELTITPQSSSTWYDMGLTYALIGDKKKAAEAYNKAVEYNPANFEAIRELRKLENKKEVFSYFSSPDPYELIKSAPSATDYPDDVSIILNSEVRKVVYPSGVTEEKTLLVAKVLTTEGVEYWKNINVGGYDEQRTTIEKAEVVKANGAKVQAETNGAEIVFTNLEVGDAVNIVYKVENHNTGRLINHFWDKFYLQRFLPAKRLKYSLLVADGIDFSYVVNNGKIEPKKQKVDEFNLYEWEVADRPALKEEEKMPTLSDVAPTLFISSIPSWDFVSKWYYDIASYKAKADFEVKEVVRELFAGKQNLSELDKVKSIYRYILKNITYSSVAFRQSGLIPQRPSTVLNTRIGDCKDVSTLFVALCKEAGIKANLVLVNSRDNGLHDMVLPSIDFNHCIAKATINGKDHYLELTSNYLPFDANYPNQINSQILDITDQAAVSNLKYLQPEFYVPTSSSLQTKIDVVDGSFKIKESTVFKGSMAAVIMSSFYEKSNAEQQKMIYEAISKEYPNVQVASVEFKGLEQGADSVSSKVEYVVSDVMNDVAGMKIFSLPWSNKAKAQDYVFNENRTNPIDNASEFYLDSNSESIVVALPKDKVFVEIPANISYTCSVADYSLTFKLVGGKLNATRSYKLKKQLVPLEDMNTFKDFYRNVIAADAKQLAIKTK